MTNSRQLVSVIIPAHNCSKYLASTLDSILNQTHSKLEIIICDDASTDGTWSILEDYYAKDDRLVLLRNERNMGISYTRDRCIREANSDYIALSDSDDVSAQNRIECQLNYLMSHEDTVLVGTNMEVCGESMRKIKQTNYPTSDSEIRRIFARYFPFVGPSAMYRRSVYMKTNGYVDGHRIAHDYLLYLEMSSYGKLANIAESLYYYRLQPTSITAKNNSEAHLGSVQVGLTAHLLYGYEANWLTWLTWISRIIIPPLVSTRLMRRISLWFTR